MPRLDGRPSATFSATVSVSTSMKCWWIIPMLCSIATVGVGDRRRLSVEEDLALIGLVHAVEDLHQRALAGTVLAQECVDLTGEQVEIDIVVGEHSGESFGDSSHLEHRGVGHVGLLVVDDPGGRGEPPGIVDLSASPSGRSMIDPSMMPAMVSSASWRTSSGRSIGGVVLDDLATVGEVDLVDLAAEDAAVDLGRGCRAG